MIDWSKPLETNETPPRPVTVIGRTKGAIDYVVVKIEGDTVARPPFDHPPGEYSVEETGGLVRGNLAVRNTATVVQHK